MCVLTELGLARSSPPRAERIEQLRQMFGWDFDEHGEPLPPIVSFTLDQLRAEGCNSMAFAVHRAAPGKFASIGEAKRNGWNKPLEIGEWTIGKGMFARRLQIAEWSGHDDGAEL